MSTESDTLARKLFYITLAGFIVFSLIVVFFIL